MNFSVKDNFSKFEQISRKLRFCSNLLKKYLTENFVFCAVQSLVSSSLLQKAVSCSKLAIKTRNQNAGVFERHKNEINLYL